MDIKRMRLSHSVGCWSRTAGGWSIQPSTDKVDHLSMVERNGGGCKLSFAAKQCKTYHKENQMFFSARLQKIKKTLFFFGFLNHEQYEGFDRVSKCNRWCLSPDFRSMKKKYGGFLHWTRWVPGLLPKKQIARKGIVGDGHRETAPMSIFPEMLELKGWSWWSFTAWISRA